MKWAGKETCLHHTRHWGYHIFCFCLLFIYSVNSLLSTEDSKVNMVKALLHCTSEKKLACLKDRGDYILLCWQCYDLDSLLSTEDSKVNYWKELACTRDTENIIYSAFVDNVIHLVRLLSTEDSKVIMLKVLVYCTYTRHRRYHIICFCWQCYSFRQIAKLSTEDRKIKMLWVSKDLACQKYSTRIF